MREACDSEMRWVPEVILRVFSAVMLLAIAVASAEAQTNPASKAIKPAQEKDVLIRIAFTGDSESKNYQLELSRSLKVILVIDGSGEETDRESLARVQRTVKFEINGADYERLLALLSRNGFDGFDGRYVDSEVCRGGVEADYPLVRLTVRQGELLKTVVHDQGCTDENQEFFPTGLFEIEKGIRTVLGLDKWLD